jgi:YD repeat-containing protein
LQTERDYLDPAVHPLNLTRTYRMSLAGDHYQTNTSLDATWRHEHEPRMFYVDGLGGASQDSATFEFGDESVKSFSRYRGSGIWVSDGSADTLTQSGGIYLYQNADDGSTWQFDEIGKLLTHTQRNGWVRSYSYGAGFGLLTQVQNQFGRVMTFSYGSNGKLSTVAVAGVVQLRYQYDGMSRLSSVQFADNSIKTYLYENASFPYALTGIVDELGVRFATYAYDVQGRGISTRHAGGAELHSVSYGATGVATVTDPLGTQRTYNYGTAKGQLAVTGADKPSGISASSAASRVQDANGFVTQETDFLGVSTMYTWDINRRLPLTTTRAAGLPEVQVTTTQWHPSFKLPVLVTEADRTTAYTYDTQGNKLSQTVTDTATNVARSTSWTYVASGRAQGRVATESVNNVVRQTYAYYGSTNFTGTEPNEGGTDLEWSRVSLLVHGTGTAGSLIVDSSLSPKPLAVLGSAQISTAQSKFGGSSILFDGGSSYVSMPASSAFQFGAENFTIESWVYQANNTTGYPSGIQSIVGQYRLGVNENASFGLLTIEGRLQAAFFAGNSLVTVVNAPNPLALNTWNHLAAVRNGNLVTLYVNGISVGSAALFASLDVSSRNVAIGADSIGAGGWNGYLSDVRITKGFARYTTNFMPPTLAFPNSGPIAVDPNADGYTAGDLRSITNAAGHVTQFTLYDKAGRVRQMIDPRGIVTDTVYTPRGWVGSIAVTPPGGTARTTTYTYDNAGQLTGVAMPDTTTMSYSYDAAHRLASVTDARGNTVSYTLDAMGNKVGEQVKDPSGNLQRNITRVYDALNRIQQVTGAVN